MPYLRPRVSSSQGVLINLSLKSVALVALGTIYTGLCQAGQAPQSSSPAVAVSNQEHGAGADKDELTAHESPATFKLRVNLVLVRVVVRDPNGKAITDLKKEDFQLTDNRKPQTITSFSVETPGTHVPKSTFGTNAGAAPSEGTPVKPSQLPQRFVTLFFDDLHLSAQDVLISRQAATKLVEKMQADDRLAIFTTSGQVQQEFTADHEKLDEALLRIVPRSEQNSTDCPPMTPYEAYSILELCDRSALQVATEDLTACSGPLAAQEMDWACPLVQAPTAVVESARRMLRIGEANAQSSFRSLDVVIRRMSELPGERIIVMMSPGFFATSLMRESGDVIDRATKANVVINTIDSRGLYVPDLYDASNPLHISGPSVAVRLTYLNTEETFNSAVLAELADGTGGTFFHNRNDLDQGLVLAAARPEVSYLLGFMPQNLKFDGKYHELKVKLTTKLNCSLQARHGYFAPRGDVDTETAANEEIQQALFSEEEIQDLPLACQTQFFKGTNGVHLTVVAYITTKGLKFARVGDRSKDNLTVVAVVFDDNGNLVTGSQKTVVMRLKDATLEHLNQSGVSLKFGFDVQPGTFLVRVVARDSEGAQMAATNHEVVIPN